MVLPKAPDFSAGPPAGWKSGDPLTPGGVAQATTTQKSSGGNGLAGSLAIGAIGAGLGSVGSYYANKPNPYNTVGGPYTPGASAGEVGGPAGPPSSLMNPPVGAFNPSSLSNWDSYANGFNATPPPVPPEAYGHGYGGD